MLEVADRRERLAHRRHWRRIERVILRLDRPALARVGPARVALSDDGAYAGVSGGGEERVGAFGPEPVRPA
jgi:hypothetical protein